MNIHNYPKTEKKFLEFIKIQLNKLSGGQTDFTILSEEENTQIIDIVLQGNTRTLYDFFDENQIMVNIFGYKEDWGYNDCEITFSSRVLAEQAAFEECFKLLENEEK